MAALRKIVLGLLLVLSLFSSQPSSAQGLKYRGNVGIPYRDDEVRSFDAVPVSDYLIEIGKDCVYRIECEPDKITNKTRLVLRQRIPINNMPPASLSMVSSDGSKLFIVGYPDPTTQLTRLWCYDLNTKIVIESAYKGGIRKISNIVDDQICLFFDNGFFKYDILTKVLTSFTIKNAPYENYDFGRGFYCSFDGLSTRHIIGNTYIEADQQGTVSYTKRLSASSAAKVDAYGNLTYFGGRFSDSGPSYLISRNGTFKEINVPKDSDYAFVCIKDVIVYSSSIWGSTQGWFIVDDDETNHQYDGTLDIDSYQDYRMLIHPDGVSYSNYMLQQSMYSSNGDYAGRFSQPFKRTPGLYLMYRWIVRSRLADQNTSWTILDTGVVYKTESGRRPTIAFVFPEFVMDFCFDLQKNLVVLYSTNGKGLLGVYSQTGQLLRSVDCPFADTCDMEPDGSILIGGIDSDGNERVSRVDVASMQIQDVLKLKGADSPVNPIYVSSSPNGNIYINRSGWSRKVQNISVYSKEGNLIETIDNIDGFTSSSWYGTGYQVVDKNGVVYIASRFDNVVKIYFADPNPPKTSASITSGWYKTNQTIQLSSVDPLPSSGD